MRGRIPLTTLERRFLCGLSRFPNSNDIELSDSLNISRSTVTSIRRRLEKEGYFKLVTIPDFQKLGCELFNVHYTRLDPLGDYEKWQNNFRKTKYSKKVFFYISSSRDNAMITATRNFTEVKSGLNELLQLNGIGGGIYDDHPVNVFFPLSLSKIFLFFDFSALIENALGINLDGGDGIDFKIHPHKEVSLGENEKKVLYARIKYPTMTEEEIGKKTGLSRQTVNKINQRFKDEEIIHTKFIPDLKKFGMELLVFTHTTYNPKTPIKNRSEGITRIVKDSNQFLIISSDTESIRLSAFKDYHEFQSKYNSYLRYYRTHNYISRNPKIRVYPLNDPNLNLNFNFSGPLEDILNINGE